MASDKYAPFDQLLHKRLEQKRFRQLRPFFSDPLSQHSCINFASSDLFSTHQHPFVKESALDALSQWGSGSHYGRWLISHVEAHQRLEQTFGQFVRKSHVFLFNTATTLHDWVLRTLAQTSTLLFIEKQLHTHLQSPIKTLHVFDRHHLDRLDVALKESPPHCSKVIFIETLSQLTGDVWDWMQLEKIVHKHDAILYVDDSSAFGVYGHRGAGMAKGKDAIDIACYHFQQNFGIPVAAIACSAPLASFFQHYLEPSCSSFPLSPSLLGAFSGILELLPDFEAERTDIQKTSQALRVQLKNGGWKIGRGDKHLVPLYAPEDLDIRALGLFLAQNHVIATYPQKQNFIRLTVHAATKPTEIKRFLSLLQSWQSQNRQ